MHASSVWRILHSTIWSCQGLVASNLHIVSAATTACMAACVWPAPKCERIGEVRRRRTAMRAAAVMGPEASALTIMSRNGRRRSRGSRAPSACAGRCGERGFALLMSAGAPRVVAEREVHSDARAQREECAAAVRRLRKGGDRACVGAWKRTVPQVIAEPKRHERPHEAVATGAWALRGRNGVKWSKGGAVWRRAQHALASHA